MLEVVVEVAVATFWRVNYDESNNYYKGTVVFIQHTRSVCISGCEHGDLQITLLYNWRQLVAMVFNRTDKHYCDGGGGSSKVTITL